jgi:ectoine hydroxylase-related dioxygenase (phytanoyl-CoA dioxygenase family)
MSNLPELSSHYDVTPDARTSYGRDGHALLRGVASADEIGVYRDVITAGVARYNSEDRPMAERDTYGKAFLQTMNLWLVDDGIKRFALSPRFAQVAADLMGVDGVRLYHDQALYKEAGGGLTPWHQDQYYWPLGTTNTVTMWMPLVDVSLDMGIMTFASGSHADGFVGELPISDESEEKLRAHVAEKGFRLSEPVAMSAGDATFHSGWTLHSAPGNDSDRDRQVMTVIYYADGATTTEPTNENQWNDLRSWFPGLEPGDVAATEINPVVFSR